MSIALIDPTRQPSGSPQSLHGAVTSSRNASERELYPVKARCSSASGFIGVVLILRKPSGEKGSGVVGLLQSSAKSSLEQTSAVLWRRRARRMHAGLLNGEVLHRRGEGFLIFVAAGLML